MYLFILHAIKVAHRHSLIFVDLECSDFCISISWWRCIFILCIFCLIDMLLALSLHFIRRRTRNGNYGAQQKPYSDNDDYKLQTIASPILNQINLFHHLSLNSICRIFHLIQENNKKRTQLGIAWMSFFFISAFSSWFVFFVFISGYNHLMYIYDVWLMDRFVVFECICTDLNIWWTWTVILAKVSHHMVCNHCHCLLLCVASKKKN